MAIELIASDYNGSEARWLEESKVLDVMRKNYRQYAAEIVELKGQENVLGKRTVAVKVVGVCSKMNILRHVMAAQEEVVNGLFNRFLEVSI